jgi:hypothetical protein
MVRPVHAIHCGILVMQHMSGVWGELSGWAAILAGLAVLACVIVRLDRRRPSPHRTDLGQAAATLDHGREWELIMHSASEGLSRGADLAALQADTALKIDAAEHAYKRLAADLANLRSKATEPVAEPAPEPEPEEAPRAPETVTEQPPLAA